VPIAAQNKIAGLVLGKTHVNWRRKNAKRRVARRAATFPRLHLSTRSSALPCLNSAFPVLCPIQSCSSEDPATLCKLKLLFPVIRPKNMPGLGGGAPEVEVAKCLDIARAIGIVQVSLLDPDMSELVIKWHFGSASIIQNYGSASRSGS
jgi:hypothetical protein